MVVWLTCAIPAGLSLQIYTFWKKQLVFKHGPSVLLKGNKWLSVSAGGGGRYNLCAYSLSWSREWSNETSLRLLGTVSQMADQGKILEVPWMQTLKRGEWNLVWVGRREDHKMVTKLLRIGAINRLLVQKGVTRPKPLPFAEGALGYLCCSCMHVYLYHASVHGCAWVCMCWGEGCLQVLGTCFPSPIFFFIEAKFTYQN